MDIGIFIPAKRESASLMAWAIQRGDHVLMLATTEELSNCLRLRQAQVVIASDGAISFTQLHQWRDRLPEIHWIAVTTTPSFAWAQEAMLVGAIGFCALPIVPEYMDIIMNQVHMQRHYHLQTVLNLEQEEMAFDLAKPIESALVYIARHLSERLTLSAVSREVYLSPSHFSRLFVQHVGVHFNDYVLAQRMDAAKNLLAETRLPIECIAMKVGFSRASYFSQTFKRLTGRTPRAYRYTSPGEIIEPGRSVQHTFSVATPFAL